MAERRALGLVKMRCPGCGHNSFHPYVDQAGQMLDPTVGRCDRENNCQYHFTPRQYYEQGGTPGILPEGWTPPDPPKQLAIPMDFVRAAKWKDTDNNTLVNWLHSLNWPEQERNMLDIMIGLYGIGTYRNGETIFWLIDKTMNVRSGKIMRYKEDGHRDKGRPGSVTWVHSKLFGNGSIDPKKYQFINCLFGEHLLKHIPNADVCIVESEKTALICSAFEGPEMKRIWLATGGLSHINDSTFACLKGRKVRLFPDVDGIEQWEEKVKSINLPDIKVLDIVKRQYRPGEDADNADIADIRIRQYGLKPETVSQKVHRLMGWEEENPAVTTLIDKLDLQIVR